MVKTGEVKKEISIGYQNITAAANEILRKIQPDEKKYVVINSGRKEIYRGRPTSRDILLDIFTKLLGKTSLVSIKYAIQQSE